MVACTTEFTGQAVGVAEPELVFRADALAVGLMTLTKSVVKTGVLSVDFFGYLHPFTGGFEINTVGLTLIYMFFHKNTGLLFPTAAGLCGEAETPYWVPAAKNGRKNPTRRGRTMSPLQVASSCSRAGLLFSCQRHRRGEQFLFVHSERSRW